MASLIIAVVIVALVFEFVNGFQDTANAIATTIFTRALPMGRAIALAAVMNFLGALASERVAKTITSGLVGVPIEEYVILAALIGAIFWTIFTWYFGIPVSCSHSLIGGLIGASIVYQMHVNAILWNGVLTKVVIPIGLSPALGFCAALGLLKLINYGCRNKPYSLVNRVFLRLQIISAAFMAFSHGNNDAQKTMGIITLALISANELPMDAGIPLWVKVICAGTMAAGTAAGGRRIIKTVGRGVTKLTPPGGFASETAAAGVIELMTWMGAPVSTTHTITSAVMGVGTAKRLSAVRWGKAKDIVAAWIITLPVCIGIGGLSCWVIGNMM